MKFHYSLIAFLIVLTTSSLVFSQDLPFSEWSPSSNYSTGDVVYITDSTTNEKTYYEAIADSVAADPIISPSYWLSFDDAADNLETPSGAEDLGEGPGDEDLPPAPTLNTGAIGQVAIDDPDLAETSTGTRIINISTRGKVVGSEDDDALVGGFVVRGTPGSTIKLIIRGLGPYMSGSIDSSLLLADPIIEVYDNRQQLIAKNDNWKEQFSSTDPNPDTTLNNGSYEVYTNQFAGGVGLNDNEAGVLLDLPIYDEAQATEQGVTGFAGYGIYTVILKGVDGATGIGQVAVDDPDLSDNGSGNRIINISTRGFAGTGDYEDLVGGFVLKGPAGGKKDFIMRGLGPYMKLTTGKDIYLTDPFMTVEKGQTVIGSSNDWATKYSANDPEPSSTLNNGNYTVYTSGFAGVGLQEKEAGLLMEMEIDSSIGFGIYTNTVKYSAP